MHSVTHRVIEKASHVVDIEEAGGFLFIHWEVTEWSKKLYQEMLEDFDILLLQLQCRGIEEIFALVKKDNKKLIKFATMFGFTYIRETEDYFILIKGVE